MVAHQASNSENPGSIPVYFLLFLKNKSHIFNQELKDEGKLVETEKRRNDTRNREHSVKVAH